jgi:hypothetical protein
LAQLMARREMALRLLQRLVERLRLMLAERPRGAA